jgi:hypothetical protein
VDSWLASHPANTRARNVPWLFSTESPLCSSFTKELAPGSHRGGIEGGFVTPVGPRRTPELRKKTCLPVSSLELGPWDFEFATKMPRSSFPRKRESSVIFILHRVRCKRAWSITWSLGFRVLEFPLYAG